MNCFPLQYTVTFKSYFVLSMAGLGVSILTSKCLATSLVTGTHSTQGPASPLILVTFKGSILSVCWGSCWKGNLGGHGHYGPCPCSMCRGAQPPSARHECSRAPRRICAAETASVELLTTDRRGSENRLQPRLPLSPTLLLGQGVT